MNALKIVDEKLHICHIMLYELQKEVSIVTMTKKYSGFLLDGALALWMVKKWFSRFHQDDFNLNNQPYSRWLSNVEDVLLVIVVNKTKISTEEIAKSLKIDISTAFCHLKEP